jgi:hypothetical protein
MSKDRGDEESMTLSRASRLGVLLIVMTSACVSVERIPDHFCTGWDDGLEAANEVRASVGLETAALDCDPDGGPLSEAEVLVQRSQLGLPAIGQHSAAELYCWGSVNGFAAPIDDPQEAQDMLGLTDQDVKDGLVRLYRECVLANAESGE